MKVTYALMLLWVVGSVKAQSISSETIDFQLLQEPKEMIDASNRNF
jgi:hypothetical protein